MRVRSVLKQLAHRFPLLRRIRRKISLLESTEGLLYRLSLFGIEGSEPSRRASPAPRPRTLDADFRSSFRAALESTFLAGIPDSFRDSPAYHADLHDHIDGRYSLFAQSIVPWLASVAPNLSEMTAIEIGSGTGASSLAFADAVGKLVCFEIDDRATAAARERLGWFGVNNVEFCASPFGSSSDFIHEGRRAQLVVLCAVLEHMTFNEVVDALQSAWNCLDPGGMLLVADTPNRLAAFDAHTSLLPFFSTLPPQLKRAYAFASPRKDFRDAIAAAGDADVDMLLTRWGSGISYHEFEVALGASVHEYVVLDGYEPTIQAICPPGVEDAVNRLLFHHLKLTAHRAFTRPNLFFVLRKPLSEGQR